MPNLTAAQRFQLSATLDRIVYGDPEVIYETDARTVLDIVPAPSRLGIFLRSLPIGVELKGTTDGSAMRGASPGMGDVSMREEGKKFQLQTDAPESVRAGQWEAYRVDRLFHILLGRQVIEVRQVMTTALDTNKTFLLNFKRRRPSGSELKVAILGGASFQASMFKHWKRIAPGKAPSKPVQAELDRDARHQGIEMRAA